MRTRHFYYTERQEHGDFSTNIKRPRAVVRAPSKIAILENPNQSMSTRAILATSMLLPFTARAAVDFVKDVQPILEYNCTRCHIPSATAVKEEETTYLLDTAKNAIRGRYIV